jgi:hypothetical protein
MRKKSKITEENLIELEFIKISQTAEATGAKKDWYYYTLDIGDMCLITNDNEDAEKDQWAVYIFDNLEIVFRNSEDLAQLVQLLQRNQTKNG